MSRVLMGLLVVLVISPLAAYGQEPISLEGIEELARLGRTEEARVALLGWWEDDRQEASRRDLQRALWLRGSLTVDPEQAALDFRRLVIEYPGGPFSDQALLRLAQASHASGDGGAARAYIGALSQDYPASPVRREAEAWLAGAGPAPDRQMVAELDSTQSVAPPDPAPEPPVPEVSDPRRFSVQLGAFADEDRARSLHRRANDAGLEARLVRMEGTQLLHVRVGLFDSSGPASELLRRVGELGFVGAMVRDANTEERIRR